MAFRVALSAFLSLVVAMGIGRFAFTPQVPLMINDHQLTLTSASLVAALNYLGYLFGSFDAMRARKRVEWRLQAGVWGAVILTLLSACVSGPWLHGLIRFLIGWASGWAMVLLAAWASDQLHHHGRPGLLAAVFAGPGTGIFISGMLAVALHASGVSAAFAWAAYGLLALLLIAAIARFLPRTGQLHRPDQAVSPLVLNGDLKRLVLSYSLAGFGYILPATFLSQMAAARFPDSAFAQFVWPVFGGAAVIGIVLGILTRHWGSSHARLAMVLWAQALGVIAAIVLPGLNGLMLGAALIGGGFLCVVQLTLQYGRELAPQHARYLAGLLTTGYAVGQLAGPLLSWISSMLWHQLEPALWVAGASLIVAGMLVLRRSK
ncbi:Predicted arabinose efflux permease, MFS family [Candidatus Pantoea symbiotica]|jgi:MFS family permease|uniref:Predicted arabinose efflux permease, MFS family n=1 Tax=Candidatus Pantoea symbiotica TaxID=1884370 RepID=A0A1I3WRC7_9GAMM|nr:MULTISPECIES: YbfB/YjiJ family MFS transporter [Pantoea]KAJ9432472.1 YbfB/YjiJ family MFS transporter [Pantoea sp. YR343]MRT23043.1 YbfB/YjiJ family MFS transporter [Enterobacteriaceae bacterium RIT697]SFK10068.1 Predicted arabinose efflux permease, MFS family [Pantoea symbiotica]SFU75178.1 Predicted arabinose efflux permease, MFS family [Pantoea sp. YR525]